MVNERVFAWVDDALAPAVDAEQPLLVADSLLITDGTAIAPGKHFTRFTDSANLLGVNVPDTFFVEAKKLIPKTGNWFPRFELVSNSPAGLQLRVRESQVVHETATVATAPGDHRTSPFVKGPDLVSGADIRNDSGQDEAIILSDEMVVEGVYSSLVWWKEDRMYRVSTSIPRLPSVTEQIIVETAKRLGASIEEKTVTPAELIGTEIWLLSALHGIRTVTAWVDGPELSCEPGRAEYWRTMRSLYKESL